MLNQLYLLDVVVLYQRDYFLTNLLVNVFSIFYNYNAAHSGPSAGAEATQNIISDIYARCVNQKADKGVVRLFIAN